jgi:hypothetical protein
MRARRRRGDDDDNKATPSAVQTTIEFLQRQLL